MTDHGERLREAFETHEGTAPDPAAVYARVRELSRTYHRRRRAAQVTGTAVLGAGLIAGAIHLPSMLTGPSGSGSVIVLADAAGAPGTAAPSATSSYSEAELEKDWAAYFGAGYGYNDAVKLAALWHTRENVSLVKAEAGRRLLAGETLPVSPHPNPSAPPATQSPTDTAALDAWFMSSYDWNDAVALARLWHLSDPVAAKVMAGEKLLAGQTLPLQP